VPAGRKTGVPAGTAGCKVSKPMIQVKFTIESDIVAAFKARCAYEGTSMTSVIRQWMTTSRPVKETGINTSTRPYRRKAVLFIIGLLKRILDFEMAYRDGIPEQFAQRFDDADRACEQLEEAIACLEDAF